jgi:hypothetical protein
MTRSGLFCRISACSLLLSATTTLTACSNEGTPAPPVAGSMAPVTAGGQPINGAGTGAPAAGGMGPSAAGAPAAGSGVAAGAGAAGMAPAGTGAAGAPAFTPGSPTFSAIYEEIIVGVGCNGGGPTCHASLAAGQLKMTSKAEAYMNLVGVKAAGVNLVMNGSANCKDSMLTRVMAGDPMSSLLVDKVSSAMPKCGGKMPPTANMLTADKIAQIRTWIMNGAMNN